MTRSHIIAHYKSFFGIEDMGMAENDEMMIDWGASLIRKFSEKENTAPDLGSNNTKDRDRQGKPGFSSEWNNDSPFDNPAIKHLSDD